MANIFQAYLQPARSVGDYMADMDRREMAGLQLEGQRGQNALQNLTRQQQAQASQQAMAENNALQRLAMESGGDTQKLIGGLRTSGMPGLMTRADALEKQALDKQKITADVGKTNAETAAKLAEDRYTALDRHARTLGMVQTPEDLVAYAETTLDILGAQGPQREQAKQQMLAKAQQLGLEQWKQAAAQQAIPLLEKFKADADMRRAQLSADTQVQTTGMNNATSRANNAATVGASYANAAAVRATAEATRDAAKITARAGDETSLRKEFADLPEVKRYKAAIPSYQAIVKAAGTNNPQADINIIYGVAKLYDPDSVVREGEYATIANSQAIPEWVKGHAQRLVGGGKLTTETKKQILEQAKIRIDSYKAEHEGAKKSYDSIVKGRGLAVENVFPAVGEQIDVEAKPAGLTPEEKAELAALRKQLGRR